jgi:hypothetical protein
MNLGWRGRKTTVEGSQASRRRLGHHDMQSLPTQVLGSHPKGQWYSAITSVVRMYCRFREVPPYLWLGTHGPLAERTGAGNLDRVNSNVQWRQ